MEDPNKERGELAHLMGNTKTRKHYICPALKKKKNETTKKNKKAKTAKLEKADAKRKELEVKNKHLQVENRAKSKEIRKFEVKEANKEADLRKNANQEEKQHEQKSGSLGCIYTDVLFSTTKVISKPK
jgi:hypothetical protein